MKLEPRPLSEDATVPSAAGSGATVPSAAAKDVTSTEVSDRAPIDVSPEGLQLAGVVTAVAFQGKIARTIRALGIVRPDETRVRQVHTKVSGWVEKLYVNSTGAAVVRGRPLLSIYSQELLTAQYEFLQAKAGAAELAKLDSSNVRNDAGDLVAAARRRLQLLDMPEQQIEALEHTGTVSRAVVLSAPVSGIVTRKGVVEGQQVDPSTELYTVTDLSQVWLESDLYEGEAASVRVGLEGRVTFPGMPGVELRSKVTYVDPSLNPETRTLRVRMVLANRNQSLKLESYANVEFPVESAEGALVPDSAILDTGLRQIIFVSPREGRFEPRRVRVGIRSEGHAQIISGVQPGERVAVKANFLLDSESRLRAALQNFASPAPAVSARPTEAAPKATAP